LIKVIPYIKTTGTQKFKTFLQTPFILDMLYPVSEKSSTDILFEDWHGKDMRNWFKFTNDDGVVLEFFPNGTYVIKKRGDAEHQLVTPKTIDEFINDMDRFGIYIGWSNWIDENFDPKDYLPPDEIKSYFSNLLAKMGKAHELM